MQLIPKKSRFKSGSSLQEVTFRGFGGGWNTVHDDLSMDQRFLVDAKNVIRTASGATAVRFGSKWLIDLFGQVNGSRFLDVEYFNGRLVFVSDAGEIITLTYPALDTEVIWNEAIANALPGTPSGWTTGLTQVDFVPFKTDLVIHNGIDKPITIDSDFAVTYLQDLASGSNINVPIGKYGCVVSNYHCVAGIEDEPTTIYVSNTGTAGTFIGDDPPNDGIVFDVGAYAPEGALAIRGIAGFRTNLIVFFQQQSLVIQLGEYTDGTTHTPQFPDTLPQFGLLGHRCIAKLSHDLLFHGAFGTSSARRNLFSGLYDTKHLNEYIELTYRRDVSQLTDAEQLISTFTVYDPAEHSIGLFLPSGKVYNYSFNEELRYRGWSYFEDQEWDCGTASALGRVFFSKDMKVYIKGNAIHEDEGHYADRVMDRDYTWTHDEAYAVGDLVYDADTDEVYECLIANAAPSSGSFANDRTARPNNWELYTGTAINWNIELPWIDGKDPMRTKQLKFGQVGTKGTARFTLRIYTDNLYKDDLGNEIYDPAIQVELVANDAMGFGVDSGNYGGSRVSRDPRLLSLPCKFKVIKFRFSGSTKERLTIANQSYLFLKGRYRI